MPLAIGGKNWQPMAYNPNEGLFYFTGIDASMMYAFTYDNADIDDAEAEKGAPSLRASPTDFKPTESSLESDDDEAIEASVRTNHLDSEGTYGFVMAVDPVREKIVWRHAKRNGQMYPMSSATDIVFAGDQGRHKDFSGVTAYHAKTGQELWKFPITNGVGATPVTYELDGESYLAVPYGCTTLLSISAWWPKLVEENLCSDRKGSGLVVFKLPSK